ncbi:DUF5684 domain-containing protein [Chitinophaga nivalis]|uniref:DUF5684 domain-containing protein n=1 Tax=Chitinophaga nivalis TaxID=2991709 RepID=A0ABT3IFB5_9BACT|nr:DUF5684 domain-containing protein [Chitinophaga nivalis]MCW3467707.1 DUF5684 domain-containing protein [Chitinophaga nivalis]MCW3482601.1 DUF5684 domain-containing protein [Chitinophaga nivalis]
MDTTFTDNPAIYSILLVPFICFALLCSIFSLICWWKIFQKAGYRGWESIIPIYGALILLRIIGKPWWWLLLYLIPGVNIIFGIWTLNLLSLSFGQGTGFTLGLVFLGFIFAAILAFDRNIIYKGPAGDPNRQLQDDISALGRNFPGQSPFKREE